MIELRNLTKTYRDGPNRVEALRSLDLRIARGAFIGVYGPSGSGKSTLLNLIGLLDEPTSGDVLLNGVVLTGLPDRKAAKMRNATFGFVFQRFNLIPHLPAWKNVAIPCRYAGMGHRAQRQRAMEVLDRIGLSGCADRLPASLSGGEEQRVAIARALALSPAIILADEPTGNLDTANGHEVMQQFARIQQEDGSTVVVVTHDPVVAEYVKTEVHLRDGQICA
ncbi:ABC transporter ATP-binding protein [Candidatus Bipolaricaulota bacterium]|nr:ABC transporter ATP-binding protein [Candidatus Bipolaricaulota bacterium]